MALLLAFGKPWVLFPTIAFALVAFFVGRWWTIFIPVAWWIAFWFGLNRVFGVVLGEGSVFFVGVFALAGIGAAAIGLLLNRAFRQPNRESARD